jgi:hypothetical protein
MGNFFVKYFLHSSSNDNELVNNNIIEEIDDSSDESSEDSCEETYYDCDNSSTLVTEDNLEPKTFFCKDKKKRALLIGINYDEDQYKDDDLNGCVNDLNNLKKFLKEKCDFQEEEIITLVNTEATKEAIEMEILNLSYFSFANPGANVWFSYSGHGTRFVIDHSKTSEVLCPYDYLHKGVISDSWLKTNFVNLLHTDTNAFVLMDCCNSGSNLNLPFRYNIVDRVSLHDTGYNELQLKELCNIVKISGCEDDQTSADYFDRIDNEFQGALTNNFLDNFENSDKNILDSYLDVIVSLKKERFSQRPVLSFTRHKLTELKLF